MRTLLLALLVLGLGFRGHCQEDSLQTSLNEGIKLNDAGDFAGAIAKYDAIIAAHPGYFQARYEKAYTLYQSGKYQECADIGAQLLKDFPGEAGLRHVYVIYGSAMDALGKPRDAIGIYKDGFRKFPDFYLLPFNKGMTEYSQKEYDDAIKDYETAIKLNRAHASSHQYLAYSIYPKNRIASAMALCGFLLFEPTGQRAEKNLKLLVQVLGANVEKKDEKTINIMMPPSALDDKGKGEDNFYMTEMTISLTAAANMGESAKDTSAPGKLKSLLEVLAIADPKKKGFFTNTYVNLLDRIRTADLLETAAHVMYMSAKEDGNTEWLQSHDDKVNQLTNLVNTWAKQ
jgi:tetratricopeptide (TPR) repeat protein